MKSLGYLILAITAILTPQYGANAQALSHPAAVVRDILSLPNDQLDYGLAKLAFDRIIDPSINANATLAEVGRLAARAGALAGPDASSSVKLSALRRVIYESGPWNGGGPSATIMPIPWG